VTQSPLADNTAGIELTVAWKTMYQWLCGGTCSPYHVFA
jgi:hypothetical protein